jgi:hypothetical protein
MLTNSWILASQINYYLNLLNLLEIQKIGVFDFNIMFQMYINIHLVPSVETIAEIGLNLKKWKIWTLTNISITTMVVHNLKNTTCLQKYFKVIWKFQWLDIQGSYYPFPKPYQVHLYNSYLHSVQLGLANINIQYVYCWKILNLFLYEL